MQTEDNRTDCLILSYSCADSRKEESAEFVVGPTVTVLRLCNFVKLATYTDDVNLFGENDVNIQENKEIFLVSDKQFGLN